MGTSGALLREEVQRSASARGGTWPAVALIFVAPLVAEFLLGNLPIKLLPALIVLAPLYGGGALLIREWVRRTGRRWPSILLLGMAYAIFEEAFTTQSLFNPNYLKLNLDLLAPAYLPTLGIGSWWTLWMFNVHALWSIATPIALVEACVPDRATAPWMGRTGMAAATILFLGGATATTLMGYRQDHYMASLRQFVGAAVVVVLLAAAAFVIPMRNRFASTGQAPSPGLVGVIALSFGSAALLVPKEWGWGAVMELLGLDAVIFFVVLGWSRRAGWGLKHQLALGSGAALAYGWHAFMQKPAVGGMDGSVRVGNAIFLAGAIALTWFAARRVTAAANAVQQQG